jgi:hypothetical protein
MMSLIHRDFGSELFGRRHLWPAVTDSPRSWQRPFSSVFVENCMIVHDFCRHAVLTTSPLSTMRWTRYRFEDPKSDTFIISLHWRHMNPQVLAVKYSRAHSRPKGLVVASIFQATSLSPTWPTMLFQILRANSQNISNSHSRMEKEDNSPLAFWSRTVPLRLLWNWRALHHCLLF